VVVVIVEQSSQLLVPEDRRFHALQAEVNAQGWRRCSRPASLQAASCGNLTLVVRGGHLRHPAHPSQVTQPLGPCGDRFQQRVESSHHLVHGPPFPVVGLIKVDPRPNREKDLQQLSRTQILCRPTVPPEAGQLLRLRHLRHRIHGETDGRPFRVQKLGESQRSKQPVQQSAYGHEENPFARTGAAN
jgi:hypothetical protein